MVVALSLQGAIPGLIVCVDNAGHVEVGTVEDACCCAGANSGKQPTGAMLTALTSANSMSTCGPCTDTLILSAPIIRTERYGNSTDIALSCDALPFNTLSCDPKAIPGLARSASPFASADVALVPTRTTTLLI